jgi:broad specificity phosphatase PhoE
MSKIVLLRHAEASKNVEDRHGGDGSGLTEYGRQQADSFASDVADYFPELSKIYTVPKPQCHETAQIIAKHVSVCIEEVRILPTYFLGVLDGLSRNEAEEQYPEHAHNMERWRRGLIEIQDLNIPNATDPMEFYALGEKVLVQFARERGAKLFVGTRSTLVLMWNVLHKRPPITGSGYFERPWDNMEWVEFLENKDGLWVEQRVQRRVV